MRGLKYIYTTIPATNYLWTVTDKFLKKARNSAIDLEKKNKKPRYDYAIDQEEKQMLRENLAPRNRPWKKQILRSYFF